MRWSIFLLTITALVLLGTVALGHAGEYTTVIETDGYLVEFELEEEFIFAGDETLITVRLEDAETLTQIEIDRAYVRITDETGRRIVSGTFAEDVFYVGTVQFFTVFPKPGTYTAEVRFEEGRGETMHVLAEASAISFDVFPRSGEQTTQTRTAVLLIAVAGIAFFSYRAFTVNRK